MSLISWLDPDSLDFPDSSKALDDPNGLLAAGGDLSSERLIAAYRQGIFPWYEENQPILWWSPNPRAVLFPSKIHLSKSLKKTIKRNYFSVSCDRAFNRVIEACAVTERKDQNGTWITKDIDNAYNKLHDLGLAHSIEVWHDGNLVGGLYGLSMGKIFFGESMFSLQTDASKVAFAYLAKQLEIWQFALIDCQVTNPHLLTLGAEEIERKTFNDIVSKHIDSPVDHNWKDGFYSSNPFNDDFTQQY